MAKSVQRRIGFVCGVIALIAFRLIASANTQWSITNAIHDLLAGSNTVTQGSASSAGVTDSGQLFWTGVITDSSTGVQDNFAPTGFATTTVIRETPATPLTIDGFASPASGRFLIVVNASATTVTFANEAAGSTAANRIWPQNKANLQLDGSATNPNTSALLWYDSGTARWRVIATNQSTWIAQVVAAGGATIGGGSLLLSGTVTHLKAFLATSAPTPTLSSCGTSPTLANYSTDVAGRFVTGSAATTCTLTFGATYTNAPSCFVRNLTSATLPTFTISATAITMTVDIVSHTYVYFCVSIGAGGT
jgi:hypothetical protein